MFAVYCTINCCKPLSISLLTFSPAVGHCHPAVAKATYLTNNLDAVTPGWDFDWGEPAYPRQLRPTLPEHLDTFLFCDSGCVTLTPPARGRSDDKRITVW